MMSPEAQSDNDHINETEFLTKLTRLVSDYRTEVPLGHLIAVLEITKMRLYYETNENLMKGEEGEDEVS